MPVYCIFSYLPNGVENMYVEIFDEVSCVFMINLLNICVKFHFSMVFNGANLASYEACSFKYLCSMLLRSVSVIQSFYY